MMLHAWLLSVVILAARPAEPAPPRAEITQGVDGAAKLLNDFEDVKALQALDALAARADLTPTEVGLIQLNRGMVLLAQAKNDDAAAAFAMARGCDRKLKAPKGISPKGKQLFTKGKPAACPVVEKAAAPAPAGDGGMEFGLDVTLNDPQPAPAPPPAPPVEPAKPPEQVIDHPSDVEPAAVKPEAAPAVAKDESAGGGPPVMAIGGFAGVGIGALLLLAGVAAVLGAGVLVGVSFPVVANAQAQERARDARQMASTAFGMRLGSIGLVAIGAVVVLVGVVGGVAGVVVGVLGLR